jgi:hypothetical protein
MTKLAIFRTAKLVAGAALAGLGIFILYGNLSGAVARSRHVLGANGSEALGALLAVIMAGAQILQVYAANHRGFLQDFLRHLLVSWWPLLLVLVGTVLSRDAFAIDVNPLPKKDCGLVDLTGRRSTLK